MAENKKPFSAAYKMTFYSIAVLFTLSRLYLGLGFRLLCARLTVHSFAVYTVLGSFMSKPQRQRVQWLCTRALYFYVHFFAILYKNSNFGTDGNNP